MTSIASSRPGPFGCLARGASRHQPLVLTAQPIGLQLAQRILDRSRSQLRQVALLLPPRLEDLGDISVLRTALIAVGIEADRQPTRVESDGREPEADRVAIADRVKRTDPPRSRLPSRIRDQALEVGSVLRRG